MSGRSDIPALVNPTDALRAPVGRRRGAGGSVDQAERARAGPGASGGRTRALVLAVRGADRSGRRRLAGGGGRRVLAGSRTTTSPRTSSIRVRSSAGIPTPEALTFSATCSGREAPMIAAATLSFCSTQATASWAIVSPSSSATGCEPLRPGRARRRVMKRLMKRGAALLVGGPRAGGRRLTGPVLAGEHALGDGGPDDLRRRPSSREVGTTSSSMTRHSIEYCGWLEISWKPSSRGERVAGADLLGGPLAHADVQRLALADDVGEGLHRLLERRLGVVPVRLVEVDVVGAAAGAASR